MIIKGIYVACLKVFYQTFFIFINKKKIKIDLHAAMDGHTDGTYMHPINIS